MTSSLSLMPSNNNFNSQSEKKNINDKSYNSPITCFKAFNSVLFMSEFIEKEENQSSDFSSYTNKEKILNNKDFIIRSPSLEKCLTNELLDSITNEPNNLSQEKNNYNQNLVDSHSLKLFNKQNKSCLDKDNRKKITDKSKKIKKHKEKKGKTLYEEIINGFQYQLKFIENSVHNILPKSYKNASNNSNKKENLDNSNINFSLKEDINQDINMNNYHNNKESNVKINNHQIHKLKKINEYYGDWICSNCFCLNRGYRKVCANCSYYRI